jgi:hypothetical protein
MVKALARIDCDGYMPSRWMESRLPVKEDAGSTRLRMSNWEVGHFAKDDWKTMRRLALNLGIHYDLETFPA